jgi:hypothetical protein
MNRRSFFKLSLGAGGALFLRWDFHDSRVAKAIQAQGTKLLDPLTIPKYAEPLTIPPVMAPKEPAAGTAPIARYEIAARQFEQQILPSGLPKTTVWGYGRAGDPLPGQGASSFNSPAFTVEARSNQRVQVVWVNHLVDNPDSAAPPVRAPFAARRSDVALGKSARASRYGEQESDSVRWPGTHGDASARCPYEP